MQEIITAQAPKPLGHYAQAITHNGLVYVSGQLPIDLNNPDKPIGSIEEQTLITLNNLESILKASNSDRTQVLKATIFISDISLWAAANQVYASFFGDHKPARSAVPTRDLPKGFQIEIEAIAVVKS